MWICGSLVLTCSVCSTVDSAAVVANMTCKKPDQKTRPYLKAHLPKRLHFANSRRIEDVGVLVEPRWLFERFAPVLNSGSLTFCSGGNHGWDNDLDSMHALFLSFGPQFQSRTEVEPFSNIELYNLMCDVLNISPADNNGTRGSLNHVLRTPPFSPAPPAEQSVPDQCPLLSLDPEDPLGCSCPGLVATAAERKHLPLGRPRNLQPGQSYCVLRHRGFVSAFSRRTSMPLWSAFTVDKPVRLTSDCLRPDVRIPPSQSQSCEDYAGAGDLVPAFLYPPNLNSTADERFDALLMSNVVPMFRQFKRIWDFFQNTLLKKYASVYNGVTVVTGPVFDQDYDGRADQDQNQQLVPGTNVSVPTHYFVVLTSCRDLNRPPSGCEGELQTVSFLLPHRDTNSESCRSSEVESEWVEDLMWFHQARVRDVEWITGLDFFQDSGRPIEELLRLKTRPTATPGSPV
uniref:Extracellular Endonuclease subunit A domain-containing protein n=1 Tax=Salarias fasciatus TaxID=181472 RepID=A0A672FN01_SALFA